jgi:hypothetical protein
MTAAERALVEHVIGLRPFPGSAELRAQVEHAVVVSGTQTQLDLAVLAEMAPSVGDGPIPTRAVVVGSAGDPTGELIVWVSNGYLSGLEYAWFTDEAPTEMPSLDRVVAVE